MLKDAANLKLSAKNEQLKYKLTIMTFLLLGCQAKKESYVKTTFDSLTSSTVKNSQFRLLSTTLCDQKNLSIQFDLSVNLKRFTDTLNNQDSCRLKVLIKDKYSQHYIDSISITSFCYYDFMFSNCDSMTSYSTKFHSDREAVDNYFGDIVVADFNFDHKDDIAVISDCGGNGGPLYSYFIQNTEGRFTKDDFLTDSMTYFPTNIIIAKQQLITYVHAGACCVGEHIYQLDKNNKTWKQVSHKILGKE